MLIPIKIPAGVYKNGTLYQSKGRWTDSNLIRWQENTIQPIGGWRNTQDSNSNNLSVLGKARGSHAWRDNGTERYLAIGTHTNLYARVGGVAPLIDITPAGLVAGYADTTANLGFGGYAFGLSSFGTPRPEESASLSQIATTWDLDNFGEFLVGVQSEDGRLFLWDLNTANDAVEVVAVVGTTPINNKGLLVTDEGFVFLLQAGGNRRRIAWCDQRDIYVWQPLATNQAGDFELQSNGEIMQAVKTRGQTLILTSADAHVAQYVGFPAIYSFDRAGSECGSLSRKAAVATDSAVYWMGEECFYVYDGFVKDIPCDQLDYVFTNLNRAQQAKIWADHDPRFKEVTWYYPVGTEIDHYITFNYRQQCWYGGQIQRTTGVYKSVFQSPYRVDPDGMIYEHEVGFNHWGESVFIESGVVELGNGDQVYTCLEILPDERSQGQVQASFKTKFYPNATEYSYGSFSLSNPTSVRFTGRQIQMKIQAVESSDWRLGDFRLEAKAGGLR